MSVYNIPTKIFDPVRLSTSTQINNFIVDTWYEHGLITQDLYTRLPGLPTLGTGKVNMSSGMSMTRPRVEIGIKINNINALPILVYIVDQGPADLLLGSDFLKLIFNMGVDVESPKATARLEPDIKRERKSLALRLFSDTGKFTITDFEYFIGALRTVHNCSILMHRCMFCHDNWQSNDRHESKQEAISRAILFDKYIGYDDRLQIKWIESGSIWLTIYSGAKTGLAWLSSLFKLTMDAKLAKAMADANKAKEEEEILRLTREEIVQAKKAEQQLRTAEAVRRARLEWQQTILQDILFRRELETIPDTEVRNTAIKYYDSAMNTLQESNIYAMIEHKPDDASK